MATEIVVRAVPGGLVAVNGVESEKLDQFHGREMMATIKIPRNLKFFRKFWALVDTAFTMADTELNKEQFRKYCTIGAGYSQQIHDGQGEVFTIPDSISFAKMDEDRFERLYQDTIGFICRTWVIDRDQLDRIVNFM